MVMVMVMVQTLRQIRQRIEGLNQVLASAAPFTHPHVLRQIYSLYGLSLARYAAGAAGTYQMDLQDPVVRGTEPVAQPASQHSCTTRSNRADRFEITATPGEPGCIGVMEDLNVAHTAACRLITGCHRTTRSEVVQRLAGFRDIKTEMNVAAFREDEKTRRTLHESSTLVPATWDNPTRAGGFTDRPILRCLPYEPWEAAKAWPMLHFYFDHGPGVTAKSDEDVRLADNQRRFADAVGDIPPDLLLSTDGSVDYMQLAEHLGLAQAAAFITTDVNLASASRVEPGDWVKQRCDDFACSYIVEGAAANIGLDRVIKYLDDNPASAVRKLIWVTDSKSLLEALAKGGIRQTGHVEASVMKQLIELTKRGVAVHMVFTFSHCGFALNEIADEIAGSDSFPANVPSETRVWYKDAARYRSKFVFEEADEEALNTILEGEPKRPCYATWRPNPDWRENKRKWAVLWPEKVTRKLAPRTQRLLNQLKAGVCSSVGGYLQNRPDPCPLCRTPDALRRGGIAIEHLFSCECREAKALREGEFLEAFQDPAVVGNPPSILWHHPMEALRYVHAFLAEAGRQLSRDLVLDENDDINEVNVTHSTSRPLSLTSIIHTTGGSGLAL